MVSLDHPCHSISINIILTGLHVPVYREAFTCWQTEFADFAGPSLTRFIAAWRSIKAWLHIHFPEVAATLRPGASKQQVEEAEEMLQQQLPLAVKMLYR